MSYLVLDIETESKDCRKRFSDPFEPTNKIVMMQAKIQDQDPYCMYDSSFIERDVNLELSNFEVLVGQNIRYDLLYLWGNPSLQAWLKAGGKIWDTKVVEYLITGQNKSIGYHLDDLAVKYGGKKKPDHTKELYKKGYTTCKIIEEIGLDTYKEYALGDVVNTEKVFLAQYDYSQNNGLLGLINVYMTHYLAIMEIEANGLHLDHDLLTQKHKDQTTQVNEIYSQILQEIKWVWPSEYEFDIDSPQHISKLLFGGVLSKETTDIMTDTITGKVVYYKTGAKIGEPRTKKMSHTLQITGFGFDVGLTKPMKKEGIYSTDDETLRRIKQPITDLLIAYREGFKLLTTYYKGFLECFNPHTGCVHSEFNLAGTRTGRLSSRSPNVQNLHPTMLDCFTSRFKDGYIIEFDWKQLEVVLAALRSRDQTLLYQLANDIDMHMINAMNLYNKPESQVSPKERKIAKFLTFGILYGAGAKSLASLHQIDVELAQRFIDQFYETYPMIKTWHEDLAGEVEANKYIGNEDKLYSFIRGWNGKRYHLEAYKSKFDWQIKRGIEHSFLPTEYKNYSVQGFAADVMNYFVGLVYKDLKSRNSTAKLIDEVHDSIILDVDAAELEYIISHGAFSNLVHKVNDMFNAYYGADKIGKPLLVLEHKIGRSWGECKNG